MANSEELSTSNFAPVNSSSKTGAPVVIADQQIRPPRRLSSPWRRQAEFRTASNRFFRNLECSSRRRLPKLQEQESWNPLRNSSQRDNSSTGRNLTESPCRRRNASALPAIPRLLCRKNFDVRPPEQPPPTRRRNAVDSCVLAADCHRSGRNPRTRDFRVSVHVSGRPRALNTETQAKTR